MAKFGKSEPTFSIVTTVALGEFEANQTLTKPMDIAEYLRLGVQEDVPDFDLDDDAIISVAKSISLGDDPEAWEETVSDALQSKARSNAPKVHADLSQRTHITGSIASSEGARLDADEAFRNELHIAGIAPVQNKRAGFRVLITAMQLSGYSIDTDGTVDIEGALDAYPRPGTYPEDKDGDMDKKWRPRKGDENTYAEYYINAGNTAEKYDWYGDFVSGTTEGKALLKEIAEWSQAIPKKGKNAQPASGPHKEEHIGYCYSQYDKFRMQYASMVRATKVAFEAYFQMQEIMTDPVMKSKIAVRFIMKNPDRDKNTWSDLSDGTDVIEVTDRKGRLKAFTMSGFNNLDLAVTREKGGTYTALIESTARGTPEAAKTFTAPWITKGKEVFLDNISPFHEWFQGGNVSEILKLCNERSKQSGERTESAKLLIVSMCDLADEFATFKAAFGGKVYQAIQKELQDAIDEATTKAHSDGVVEPAKKTA